MFIKKTHVDIKKLITKIQDSKKDTASRLRHLKTILGKNTQTLTSVTNSKFLPYTIQYVYSVFLFSSILFVKFFSRCRSCLCFAFRLHLHCLYTYDFYYLPLSTISHNAIKT